MRNEGEHCFWRVVLSFAFCFWKNEKPRVLILDDRLKLAHGTFVSYKAKIGFVGFLPFSIEASEANAAKILIYFPNSSKRIATNAKAMPDNCTNESFSSK